MASLKQSYRNPLFFFADYRVRLVFLYFGVFFFHSAGSLQDAKIFMFNSVNFWIFKMLNTAIFPRKKIIMFFLYISDT